MMEQKRLPDHINYLCIEGVIGAGKTSLCTLLAEKFNARTVFEAADENPFLADFYKNRQSMAFQTQLWFLLSRYRQLTENFVQQDLFHRVTVADYIFAKDSLFASINLDENELSMYNAVMNIIEKNVPKPDFIIYLQASTDVLMKRIEKRGRSYERAMDRAYIEMLNNSYTHFFFHYKDSPVLIVNTDDIDYVNNTEDFEEIIDQIALTRRGSNYYRPLGSEGRAFIDEKREQHL
jgi:deoxyadenosine/deoxycytidine kinase